MTMTFDEFSAELSKLTMSKEIEDKFYELVKATDEQMNERKIFIFGAKTKSMVHELAEMIRKRPASIPYTQKRNQVIELYLEAIADKEPEIVYLDLLEKFCNAPTRFHRDSCVLTLIPIIDDKLRKER